MSAPTWPSLGLLLACIPHLTEHTWLISRREEEEVVGVSVFLGCTSQGKQKQTRANWALDKSVQCLPLTSWVILGNLPNLLYFHFLTSQMGA